MSPLEILLEIVKLTLPGLVVFATVYTVLKQMTTQTQINRRAEQTAETRKVTVNLRLQAYERLSLYCERISIPNLLLRLRTENTSVHSLKWAMMQAIRQEFEHNITQQIYVSEQLWQILKLARDTTTEIIDQVASSLGPDADANAFVEALFDYLSRQEKDPLTTALVAIKREAALAL